MSRVCTVHGRDEKCIQTSGWKTQSEETTGADEVMLKWIDCKETALERADQINLVQPKDQWQATLSKVMNLLVP